MRRSTRIIAAALAASALILSACGSSDSAPKQRNSAIAQPGEGLNIKVYKIKQGQGNMENTPTLGYGSFKNLTKYYLKQDACKNSNSSVANIDGYYKTGVIEKCDSDGVLIHYYGSITIPGETGADTEVKFQNNSDDGFQMSIAGNEIISDWAVKSGGGQVVKVSLPAGKKLPFSAWYFDNKYGAFSILSWALPGYDDYQVVPPSAFSPGDDESQNENDDEDDSESTTSTTVSQPTDSPTTTVAPTTTTKGSSSTEVSPTTTNSSQDTTTTQVTVVKEVIVDDTTPITIPPGSSDIPCNLACVASIRVTLGVTGDVFATVGGKKVLLDGTTAIPADGTEVVFSNGGDKTVTVALESGTPDSIAVEVLDSTSGNGSSFPWIIVIIAIVIIAGGGYVAATRKKKEQK